MHIHGPHTKAEWEAYKKDVERQLKKHREALPALKKAIAELDTLLKSGKDQSGRVLDKASKSAFQAKVNREKARLETQREHLEGFIEDDKAELAWVKKKIASL